MNSAELTTFMNRAYQFGQLYWQQADSDSYKQNAKSDETRAKFEALKEEAVSKFLEDIRDEQYNA